MKKQKLDLNRKLVLNKETIANLTPGQQAQVVGGYPLTKFIGCSALCSGATEPASDCVCVSHGCVGVTGLACVIDP
jgi:hypothetical protein